MKVKATKVMAKEITNRTGYKATLVKFTEEEYERFVTVSPWCEMADWDSSRGLFSVIRVNYEGELYANPLYLTTNDLTTILRNSDGTFEGFFKHLKDSLEI